MAPAMTMQPETSCVCSAVSPFGRIDQHAIPHPDVALAGSAIDGIDNLSADKPGQHGKALLPGKASANCCTMLERLGNCDGADAATALNVPTLLE